MNMKMNFKYVSMMAVAAIMAGFTSCSSDKDGEGPELPGNGEKTLVKFDIKVQGAEQGPGSRALSADPTATAQESKINGGKLYIFGASQTLETTLPIAANGVVAQTEVTTGLHYFLAAVNFAAVPTVTVGETMSAVKAKLVAAAGVDALTQPNAFYMTSLEETYTTLASKPTVNSVSLKVGRATAKVNLSCTNTANVFNQLEGSKGKLVNIKYAPVGYPKAMNFFPVITSGVYTTYYHSTAYNPANYLTVGKPHGLTMKAPYNNSDESASAKYMIENSSNKPLKGNSNYLLIEGKYEPAELYDAQRNKVSANANGTFYRVFNVTQNKYYDLYFTEDIDLTLANISDKLTTIKADRTTGDKMTSVKYENGICYYAFYLKNGNDIVVKRNDYFNVVLSNVNGAGSSVPTIEGENDKDDDGHIPGTGGGDGDKDTGDDKEDPINEEALLEGTITVAPWTVVNQGGGL